jgi:hypothetical protein
MMGAAMTMTGAGLFAAGGAGLFDIVASQYSDWYSVDVKVVWQQSTP